jgi:hypothetical protein
MKSLLYESCLFGEPRIRYSSYRVVLPEGHGESDPDQEKHCFFFSLVCSLRPLVTVPEDSTIVAPAAANRLADSSPEPDDPPVITT